MATDVTINEPRGLSIGVYRLFADIGFVIGPIILGFVADNFGLKIPFYLMAAILFVNAVLILLFAKETYSKRERKSAAGT
jgi:DHA1 family multidrug resistance protein-like MFS transporter